MSDSINKLRQSSLGGKFKFLLKDSFIYGGLSALTKFFSIFLTPILVRFLNPTEYGTVDIFNPIISILATIVVFGMDSAVARFYYNTEDGNERKGIISNAFWVQIVLTIIVCGLTFAISKPFLHTYFGDSYSDEKLQYLYTIILIVVFSTPVRFAQNLLRWVFMRNQFLVLSIASIVLNFAAILICVYVFPNKILAVFFGQLISAFVCAIYAIFTIKNYIVLRIDRDKLFQMLKYGIPLMIVAFIPSLLPSLDRYFINKYLGIEDVAIYGIGYRIASLAAIPILSINTAIGPFIYAIYKEANAEKVFNLLALAIIIFVSFMIMLIVLVAPIILSVIANQSYVAGLFVVAPISFYFLFDMLKSIGGMGIELTMKTYLNPIIYLLNLIITVVLFYLFTPRFGIFGAANALMVGAFINFLVFTIISNRIYTIKFNLVKKSIVLLLGYTITVGIYFYATTAITTILSVVIIFAFVLVSYVVFIEKEDKLRLKDIVQTKLLRKQ